MQTYKQRVFSITCREPNAEFPKRNPSPSLPELPLPPHLNSVKLTILQLPQQKPALILDCSFPLTIPCPVKKQFLSFPLGTFLTSTYCSYWGFGYLCHPSDDRSIPNRTSYFLSPTHPFSSAAEVFLK